MLSKIVAMAGFCVFSFAAVAGKFDHTIPMLNKGAATYYVDGAIEGVGPVEFMVDTGSSYMTINEETISLLKDQGRAKYLGDLRGRLANGDSLEVPLYSIRHVKIGSECTIDKVEAAVFPGKTRFILGLSALRKASPFIFSVQPPELVLSNCGAVKAVADGGTT
jgi:predicted aspartyl protease